jgi:hypothetical protein
LDIKRIEQILSAKGDNRIALIKSLQNEIWERDGSCSGEKVEILADLAYDLDFYEPDPAKRAESASFYDDRHLDALLQSAISDLRQLETP